MGGKPRKKPQTISVFGRTLTLCPSGEIPPGHREVDFAELMAEAIERSGAFTEAEIADTYARAGKARPKRP